MKWMISITFVIGLVVFFLANHLGDIKTPNGAKAAYELTVVHRGGLNSPDGLVLQKLAKVVQSKTNNQVVLKISHDSREPHEQMFEKLMDGQLDLYLAPSADLTPKIQAMQILDVPFLFESRADYHRLLDGMLGEKLLGFLQAYDVAGLGFWDGGFKQFYAKKTLSTKSDFQGVNIGVSENIFIMEQMRRLGANPIPVKSENLMSSISNGTISAQENTLFAIDAPDFDSSQKYLTKCDHSPLTKILMMSRRRLNKLPSVYQQELVASVKEISSMQRRTIAEQEGLAIGRIREQGLSIIDLEDSQKEGLKSLARSILSDLRKSLDPAIYVLATGMGPHSDEKYIYIGLDTDLEAASAPSGKSIQRGANIAIDELNEDGGVLGKKLKLIPLNNSGIAARGISNIKKLAENPSVVAVMGGIHSPVALAEIPIIHEKKMIYLDPWAAATKIVSNGQDPNFVFRVSVRDEYAGPYLVRYALGSGYEKIGLLLENTPWGRGNEASITKALKASGKAPVGVEWFNWTEESLADQIARLLNQEADAIILVSNAPEGIVAVRDMALRTGKKPIISHWGITGGYFWKNAKDYLKHIDLAVLQTHSFFNPQNKVGQRFIQRYFKKYNVSDVGEIFAPVGAAHAYDLVHLLALAMRGAGSLDRVLIRSEMEKINIYHGLIKTYKNPFSWPDHHDALTSEDFSMARYNELGHIIPIEKTAEH